MVKVTISAKIEEELKGRLEEQAKEKGITMSQMIEEKLKNKVEKEENSHDEFSLIKNELKEKNKQISQLQQQVLNQQEIELYKEKRALLKLESSAESDNVVNAEVEEKVAEVEEEKKRGLFNWFKRY